ncbi:MAG: hypothetical protein KC731_36695 [Myxococcales bacterium]|nr:hypothetical protein [Myxococcales bacterium]
MSLVDRLFDRVGRFWLAPAPPRRLATARILVGAFACLYLLLRLPHFADYAGRTVMKPVGVVGLVLREPLPATATWALALAALATGVAFTVGFFHRLTGPLFAALLLWVTTYASSFGMLFHTDNLLVLHVIVLGLAPAADALSLDARGRPEPPEDSWDRYGWGLRLACAVTAATYLVAGATKLRVSGLDWVTSDLLRSYVAYDALRKAELGSTYSPLGAWLTGIPSVWPVLATFSLTMELGAPLALLGPRSAKIWVAAAWLFHLGVAATMAIAFFYPLSGLAFATFFPLERLAEPHRREEVTRWFTRRMRPRRPRQ